MEITVTKMNGRVPVDVIHIEGKLDSSSYGTFKAKAKEMINEGTRYILLDLTKTTYISSAGLSALQAIFTDLRALDTNVTEEAIHKEIAAGTYKSPHLKLVNLSKEVNDVIKISGFDMFIEISPDLIAAVNSF